MKDTFNIKLVFKPSQESGTDERQDRRLKEDRKRFPPAG